MAQAIELWRVRYDGGLQTLQGGLLSAPTGASSASQKSWSSNSPSFVNTSRVFFGLERSRWILVEGCTSGRHFGSALQVNQLTESFEWLGITSGLQSFIFGAKSTSGGMLLSLWGISALSRLRITLQSSYCVGNTLQLGNFLRKKWFINFRDGWGFFLTL